VAAADSHHKGAASCDRCPSVASDELCSLAGDRVGIGKDFNFHLALLSIMTTP